MARKQRTGPLKGVRIIDLTRYLAGPYGSMILGDLGAEIIKIEPPAPRAEAFGAYHFKGEDPYFLAVNRNKKSMVVNLQAEKGRQVLYDLVKVCDVVFDNFRPGVVERLKFDYETLRQINSGIICCSIAGFGSSGPYRDRPSYDLVAQAISGGMSLTGEPGQPPVRAGVPIADLAGGIFAAHGIIAALYAREVTGEGQKVETSVFEGQLALLVYEAAYCLMTGIVPTQIGSRHRFIPIYGAFQTKDSYIAVAAPNDVEAERLFPAIGHEDWLADPRFNNRQARLQNWDDLVSLLKEVFLTRSTEEWLDILLRSDVPCSAINTLDKALADPQVLARDMVVPIEHTSGGQIRVVGDPIKMSGTEEHPYRSPPLLGEHTDEVLSTLLGYSAEKIGELRKEDVVR